MCYQEEGEQIISAEDPVDSPIASSKCDSDIDSNPVSTKAPDVVPKLFVGSLPLDVMEDDLMSIFTRFGEVLEFLILRERDGQSKGCARLRYATPESAMQCIQELHGRYYCGDVQTPMQVRYFEHRTYAPTNTLIEGVPSGMPLSVVCASLSSVFGPLTNIAPRDPTSCIASFINRSSAFALLNSSHACCVYLDGMLCPSVRVTLVKNPFQLPPVSPFLLPPVPAPPVVAESPTKLFVGCLPYSKTAQDLADLFSPFGQLLEVAILVDYYGKSRGAAFVTFARSDDAHRALDNFKDYSFQKGMRPINLSIAHRQNIWVNNRNNQAPLTGGYVY